MFGLFKKAITPDEFGRIVVSWANEFLVDDAGLSLARLFDEFWDDNRPDNGEQFLERMGIPAPKTHLYVRQFAHCASSVGRRKDVKVFGCSDDWR
jgi:hypothetical protein